MTKQEWLKKNGFNEAGETYSVLGDSYAIKDQLKEWKYIFSPLFKWHCGDPHELPEGFSHVVFKFDDIYKWDDTIQMAFFLEDSKEKIDRVFNEAEGPSLSEYVGMIGDKLSNITAIYKSARGYSNPYGGYTNIYTFESENNIFVWFTTTTLAMPKGTVVNLSGTIKKYEEFRGVKTTVLTRCKVAAIQ